MTGAQLSRAQSFAVHFAVRRPSLRLAPVPSCTQACAVRNVTASQVINAVPGRAHPTLPRRHFACPQVLADMQTDPSAGAKHMAHPEIRAKISKLVAAGIIQTR